MPPHDALEARPGAPLGCRCRQELIEPGVEVFDIAGRGLLPVGVGEQEPHYRGPEVVTVLVNGDPRHLDILDRKEGPPEAH